ncbi:tRNA 2'-phosphotransferase 1, partial [Halocaridina rubra]
VTVAELKSLVAECPKQRFQLKEDENGDLLIKANQGHTIEVENPELEEVTSETDLSCVVHGTYYKSWSSIKKEGLSRMKRTHIHFAPGIPGDSLVVSGIRSSCQIYIYIDIPQALQDGFKFYRSDNNVLLCRGNDAGFLPCRYFQKVVDKKTGQQLEF